MTFLLATSLIVAEMLRVQNFIVELISETASLHLRNGVAFDELVTVGAIRLLF